MNNQGRLWKIYVGLKFPLPIHVINIYRRLYWQFFEKTNLLEKTTAKLDLYNAIYEEEEKSTVETEISTEETETEQFIQETQKTEEQIVEIAKPSPKNVIYLSDVFVTTQDAQGTLSYLADKGYNVFAFSFFDKLNYFNNFMDSKTYSPFFLRYEYKTKSENLQKNKEMFVHQKITEFTSILTMMEKFGQLPVYILAEGNCIPAAEEIQQKYGVDKYYRPIISPYEEDITVDFMREMGFKQEDINEQRK